MNREQRNILSPLEVEILRWVQEGKTNDEIGIILGMSKWGVKYHLRNIMERLDVTTRTQAVSQAMGQGLLHPRDEAPTKKRPSIAIVGCGRGGASILEILKDNPSVGIEYVVEKDPYAAGVERARSMNIPVVRDIKSVAAKDIDVIINVTGSREVNKEIRRLKPDAELIEGISAMLMWQLADERRKRLEERERALKEHEALYHLGLIVENIGSMKDAGYAIVDYAAKLTHMPAGLLAVFDEKREEMIVAASKGFSEEFKKVERWGIRKGDLTDRLFNQSAPLVVPDLKEFPNADPLLLKEGVRSVLAAPLMIEGRVTGILQVNDFKKRSIRAEDSSLFTLLSVYAALAVERVRSIEEMRKLSIVDGLTDLFNHRHIMEVLHKEQQRASRHNSSFSLVIVDIDHFKSYNDTFGHLEGNKVLREIARLFRINARSTDTVGRFGGEEFCIVAPELDKKHALAFARKLLSQVSNHGFPNRRITISAGVATFPEDGDTVMALLEKADKMLYKAKDSGRNGVCS